MIKQIDHIGIAVTSISEARRFYEEALGLKVVDEEEVASQMVRVLFLRAGEINIELLEPTAPESPIARFLKRHGPGIHHIAYLSDDLSGEHLRLRQHGCKLLSEEPITGAHGKEALFIHPSSACGALSEIVTLGAKEGDKK